MSRIEKGQNMQVQMDRMKGEVVKEIKSGKKGQGKLTCSLFFLAGIFLVLGWMLWSLAATGLWNIPGVSKYAFDPPVPVRIVPAGVPLETVVQESLQTVLTRRLQEGGGVLNDTSVSLTVDEKSFTSTFRTSLESSEVGVFDYSRVQIAIEEDGTLEVFLPVEDAYKETAIIIYVTVGLVDGSLSIKADHARVGSLKIPSWLTTLFAQSLIEQQLPALNQSLGQYASIDSLTFRTGSLTVLGNFVVEILDEGL